MQKLDELKKPCSEEERIEFIKEYQTQTTFIEETEKCLSAWGYTKEDESAVIIAEIPTPTFEEIKADKYAENDRKASESRYNQKFEIEIQGKDCIFDTSDQTQRDLLTAFAVCSTGETYDGWITNNGVKLDLTLEDVALISQTFKLKSNVYDKWNEYKKAIDKAKTIKDLERIVIEYD